MRHARIERWSREASPIHRRHAASRILATLALLISIATLKSGAEIPSALYLLLLLLAAAVARLPLPAMLRTAAAVLPFALCFAAVSILAGDPLGGAWLVIRACLSAFAALFLIATTPMPDLAAGLEWLHAPRFLTQIMQFLYRYLIVLMEEANAMRQAGAARAGTVRALEFRRAAAAAGVLFARSYARAQAIHRAMLSRGFEDRLPAYRKAAFGMADAAFLATALALIVGIRAIR